MRTATAPRSPATAALDRRGFLRACWRYPVLAGLTLLGARLALRQDTAGASAPCFRQPLCRDCGLFSECAQPQAVATREGVR